MSQHTLRGTLAYAFEIFASLLHTRRPPLRPRKIDYRHAELCNVRLFEGGKCDCDYGKTRRD